MNRQRPHMEFIKPTALLFVIIGSICFLSLCCPTTTKISDKEAITIAEQFVLENGYTDKPANRAKIRYELLDRYLENIDSVLNFRFNTLQPKAYCIAEGMEDEWDVGFLSVEVNLNKLREADKEGNLPGRAVLVSKDGKDVHIAHKDPLFSKWRRLR